MSHHIAIDGIFSLNLHGSGPMKQLIMNTSRYQIDLRYWCQHTLKLSHIRANMTPIEPNISSKLELHIYTVTHSTHNSGVINMRYINGSLIETILNFEVSAKNEGKFGFFAPTKIMNFCISHKIKLKGCMFSMLSTICVMVLRTRISQHKIQVTLKFSPNSVHIM